MDDSINIQLTAHDGDRYSFGVTVGGRTHQVTLTEAYYQQLTGGAITPEELVQRSFAFLLEREPAEAILPEFELALITQYFPEYETVMQSQHIVRNITVAGKHRPYNATMSKKKKRLIIAVAVVAALVAGVGLWAMLRGEQPPAAPPEPSYGQLTGVEVRPDIANRPVIGIIVDNAAAARPQTGLGYAGIVLESVTEGGITRYLALYQEELPDIVGPVRSLRPHFLDWALGFDASIAHVGGSPEALQRSQERGARSLGQFTYSDPYFRDASRSSPHNMYVRIADLRELQRELEVGTSEFDPLPRKSDRPAEQPDATAIDIDFAGTAYAVEFRYNTESNTYTRYLAGSPHVDPVTDEPITVKNLIVMKTPPQTAGTDAIGSGEAILFMDGTAHTIAWRKDSYETRVKFLNSEGSEVVLNRGSSWIAVLPDNRSVTY